MIGGWILGAVLLVGQGGPPAQFYGDYRTVQALALTHDGRLFAAAKGGLISYDAKLVPHTFGWNGLIGGRGPDDVWTGDGKVFASVGESVAVWDGARFLVDPALTRRPPLAISFGSSGYVVPVRPVWPTDLEGPFAATAGNVGTHVSAVTGDGNSLVAAWYGDGIWSWDHGVWKRIEESRKNGFDHIRAMTQVGDNLALATYGGDIWWRQASKWKRLTALDGLHGSVYSLALFKGSVFAGTFENGVARLTGSSWAPLSSSDHPREMAVFRGDLYVRQTTGQVDRFDGRFWVKNVFPWLPRSEASCLAVGDGRILVGQYGGWSEWDGVKWSHYLRLPELESYEVTALAAHGGQVWVGTQERGAFLFDRKTGKMTGFDQRQGLGDDWVRGILADDKGVVVGLFRSGAFALEGDSFARLTPRVANEATGLAREPLTGQLFVGSREGLWRIDGDGAHLVPVGGIEKIEIQALLGSPTGLWMGMPNGTAFVPWNELTN
jgi:hypothetical protein